MAGLFKSGIVPGLNARGSPWSPRGLMHERAGDEPESM